MSAFQGTDPPISSTTLSPDTISPDIQTAIEAYCGFLIITGSIGNLMIITTIIRQAALHTDLNVYLGNLAVIDFLVSSVVNPLALTHVKHTPKPLECRVVGFLTVWLTAAGWASLGLVAMNLYIRVCRKNLYKIMFTKRNVVSSLIATWVIVFIMVTPPLWGVEGLMYEYNDELGACLFGNGPKTKGGSIRNLYFASVVIALMLFIPIFSATLVAFLLVFRKFRLIHARARAVRDQDIIDDTPSTTDSGDTMHTVPENEHLQKVLAMIATPPPPTLQQPSQINKLPAQFKKDDAETEGSVTTTESDSSTATDTTTNTETTTATETTITTKHTNDTQVTAPVPPDDAKPIHPVPPDDTAATAQNQVALNINMNSNPRPDDEPQQAQIQSPPVTTRRWSIVSKASDSQTKSPTLSSPPTAEEQLARLAALAGSTPKKDDTESLSVSVIAMNDNVIREVVQYPQYMERSKLMSAMASIQEQELAETEDFTKSLFLLWLGFLTFYLPTVLSFSLSQVQYLPKSVLHLFFAFSMTSSSIQFVDSLSRPKFRECFKHTFTFGKFGNIKDQNKL